MDLASRIDYFQIGRAYYRKRALNIDPAKVDVAGSDANLIVGGASIMAAKVAQQIGYALSTQFLASCFDDDLDRYVFDRSAGQVTRKGASPAVVVERFFRGPTGPAGTIPVGTILRTVAGVGDYVLTTPATFALNGASATARARCTVAGKAAQVGANNIRAFANSSQVFDQTIQLTNDAPAAGGEDREDDDTLKARFSQYWQSLSKGTAEAIQFGALTVPGVVSAMAVEALTPAPMPARVVNLYIADSTGVANAALAALVTAALDKYRAFGIAVLISTSIPVIVPIGLALQFTGNVDTATLAAAVQAGVVTFVNTLPVNGTLFRGSLLGVIQRYASLGVVPSEGSVLFPAGDVVPAIGTTLRTNRASVTLS